MKLKQNPFICHHLALAAGAAFLAMGSANAATYDWTGASNNNFTDAANWGGTWTQWDNYRFGGTPTNASVTINGYFGIGSLTLQSGLTTDIVINSSHDQPVIMNTAFSNSGQAAISIAADSRNLTINGEYIANNTVTWDIGTGRTLTMNGPLNNWFEAASLIKNGAGTATLTQKSNYTGGTTVNGGTLNLADGDWMTGQPFDGGATGATGGITVGSGATLSTSVGVTEIRNGLTLNGGTVSSRGNAHGTGNGSWGNLLLSSNITAGNSATSLISSEIRLNADRSIEVGSGSTLNITGGIAICPNYNGGIFSAGITKTGDGTLTLSGANSYNGTTRVSGGTLVLPDGDWRTGGLYSGGTGASGTIIVEAGATLSTSAGVTGLQNGLILNGGTVSSRGVNYPYNYRNLLLESNITAGGAATSTISSEISLRGYRSIDVGTGSTLNITGGIANDGFDGGSQGITKTGDGTLKLSGTNNSYTGGTVVNAGTLVINGNISTSSMTTVQTGAALGGSGTVGSLTIDSGAFLNPGNSPGILNVDGDYNQAGTLNIEVTGTTPGLGGYDQVNVDRVSGDGSVSLSGSLVTAFSGGSYANGNLLFILLNDASDAISGTFSGLAQDAIVATYGGFDWKISYTADSTGNTFTGGNDIALMAVPEPNVAALLGGLGMLCLLRRRRA